MFDDFLTWWTATSIRRTGKPPAETTLVAMRERLKGVSRMMQTETPEILATLLSDRQRVVLLLDMLYARQSPGTIRNVLVTLRHFGEYAKAMGWSSGAAIERTDAPSANPQKPIDVYSQSEIDLLLLFARARGNLRHWCFLMTMVETGRRIGEILSVRYENLHLSDTPPYIDLPTTKNQRQAYVPLSTRLRDEVYTEANLAKLREAEHANTKRASADYLYPFGYRAACDFLQRLCEIAGVPYRGWHCFRHTKATRLLEQGAPIQAVSRLLGHTSVVTTDRTYHHATALSYASYLG